MVWILVALFIALLILQAFFEGAAVDLVRWAFRKEEGGVFSFAQRFAQIISIVLLVSLFLYVFLMLYPN
jgi:hypothetical protein